MTTGRLRFYDGPTAWGLIVGDDGHLYMLHGRDVLGTPLREGERVRFAPVRRAGGLSAIRVQRVVPVSGGAPSEAASGVRT
jgi:cold shock CspA family protein